MNIARKPLAAEDIWSDFRRWAEVEGLKSDWSRRRVLGEVADLKGVAKFMSSGYTKFKGLRLKGLTVGEALFGAEDAEVDELI